jgi:hypothetical protein
MNNHYHLIIETPDGNLTQGMRQLNGVYTQAFNKRHRKVGHVYQGRYKAILIQKESHLLEVCRYVVLNPVRAKMVEKPEQWKWSSYVATSGRVKAHECLTTDWVLGQFGTKRLKAKRQYRQFVRDGIRRKSVLKGVKAQSILGGEEFVENLKGFIKGHRDIAEIPKSQRYLDRPGLEDIFKSIKHKNMMRRNKKILEAVQRYGYTQREIGDHLGMHFTSISRIMRKTR